MTFEVSASSFAVNMSVKQNALDFTLQHPLAAKIIEDSFYVDTLTGADFVKEADPTTRTLLSSWISTPEMEF